MLDVLSDTLRAVRLSGAVFLHMRMTAPWAAESEPPAAIAEYLRLPSDCISLFHVLVRGEGWFCVPGHAPALLRPGDAILLPHCAPHVMRSDRRAAGAPTPLRYLLPYERTSEITRVEMLNSGASAQFICGYLHCDQRFNPLLGALPELIVASRSSESEARQDAGATEVAAPASRLLITPGDWLAATLDHMIEEALSERAGGAEMLARLSEILFVEMVRRYMDHLPLPEYGWLAGIRDPVVGQGLRLMHAQPERAWTVAELATAAASSRSAFAQRFTALIGETPMGYLAGWRMSLAKQLLKETRLPLTAIADRVGYGSEVAFNRAFKRYIGLPPATWRATDGAQASASRTPIARAIHPGA